MSASAAAATRRLISLEFEVFGRVQGVFFRKHTVKKSKEYGLVGWVKNTRTGTVLGQLQGEQRKVQLMKQWLSTTGSPKSKISRCEFRDEKSISKLDFTEFKVLRE